MIRRILLFIETGGPGGAERTVLELARGLRAKDAVVDVATCRTGWLTETLAKEQFGVTTIPSERSLDISLPLRLAKLCRDLRADVLHTHLLDSNFYGALAARISRTPHLATEHGDVHHIAKKRFQHLKLRLLGLNGTHFSAVSKFTAKRLAQEGVKEKRIHLMANPVSLPLKLECRAEVRAELGIPETDWMWLHVANFRPVKDQDTLIRGFAISCSNSPAAQKLVIIGDGEDRSRLEKLAADLGVDGSVRFIGFRDDVQRFLAAADGFLLTSRSEAMPMVLLEAAWFGLSIISSEVGGVPELVNGKGKLFPPGDSERLATSIAEALREPEECRRLAKQLQAEVRHNSRLDRVVDGYLQLYDRLRS